VQCGFVRGLTHAGATGARQTDEEKLAREAYREEGDGQGSTRTPVKIIHRAGDVNDDAQTLGERGRETATAQSPAHLKSLIVTTSLVCVPRADASCLPSRDQSKKKE
jgi:hypothetical protein